MSNKMNTETALKVFDVLVEQCGCSEKYWDDFRHYVCIDDAGFKEYHFGGLLGTGGKFYMNIQGWYVGCYREEGTILRHERINTANVLLEQLQNAYDSQPPTR